MATKQRYEKPRMVVTQIDPATFAGAYNVELPIPGLEIVPRKNTIEGER